MRTPGYPIFLRVVQDVFGNLKPAVYVQLATMVGATGFLSNEIRKCTNSLALGVIATLLILLNFLIIRYAFTIMSEAFFFAGVTLVLGLICRFGMSPKPANLAWVSFAIGLCVLIRPIAYAFLPVLVICVLFHAPSVKSSIRYGVAVLLPLGVVLAVGSALFYAHHGSFRTQSFMGHNLIGKIAYLPAEKVVSKYPEAVQEIDRYMRPIRAVRVPNWRDRYLYQSPHYDRVRYRLTTELFDRLAKSENGNADDLRKEVAFAFIRTHPWSYASEVALQLYALWAVSDLRTRDELVRFQQFVQSLPFDPYEGLVRPVRKSFPKIAVFAIRIFMAVVFGLTLLAIGCGAYRWIRRRDISANLFLLIQSSILIHIYFLATAAVQFGHFRYFVVMWPVIITVAVTSIAWLGPLGMTILGKGRSDRPGKSL